MWAYPGFTPAAVTQHDLQCRSNRSSGRNQDKHREKHRESTQKGPTWTSLLLPLSYHDNLTEMLLSDYSSFQLRVITLAKKPQCSSGWCSLFYSDNHTNVQFRVPGEGSVGFLLTGGLDPQVPHRVMNRYKYKLLLNVNTQNLKQCKSGSR